MDVEKQLMAAVRAEGERAKKKMLYALTMLCCVYVAAIAIYHYTEKWGWEDSIYFTTSTITTVGYGDLVPHTYYGRLITIPLMWIGIAVGLYFIYSLQEYGRVRAEERIDIVARRLGGFASSGKERMGRLAGKRKK
ncbi:MAG: potassium channel family protein [Candidatus Micrarchaeia archaeon]